MVSLQPRSSSQLPSLAIPILQLGPPPEHPNLAFKPGWTIEFLRRSTRTDRHLPSHSISLIARKGPTQWHVRVTFTGEPCRTGQGAGQKPFWPKRGRDFKALCCCIDFDPLPLPDDKFTELLISPEPNLSAATQLLQLKELPSSCSDYASFRTASLWFLVQEYHEYIRYPPYSGIGRTIHLRNIQRVEDIDSYEHVNTARILGDDRQYVYKGVDRLIYYPQNTEVLEQELRNLVLLHGSKRIVQLVAAVISSSPYQTRESEAPPVLRGILLQYHPNGTLHDILQSPDPWMHSSSQWLQWALDISTALAHMHQMGVTHMDLKPKNVVISREWNAILIDVSGIGGTTDEFLLPELFETLDRCSESWELRVQSDIWALGKILASMAQAMDEVDVGKEDNRLGMLDIAQEIERTRGCISLDTISGRLSNIIASMASSHNNE